MLPFLQFKYIYFPVGQGLFSSGGIRVGTGSGRREFTWIYDCGTTSGITRVADGVDALSREYDLSGYIDLLVLSHFDADHIRGVPELLSRFRIKTLVLPFLNLERRLIAAVVEGADPGSALMQFLIDPVGYLMGLPGRGIDHILFVQAGGEGSTPPVPDDGDPTTPQEDGPLRLRYRSDKEPDDLELAQLIRSSAGQGAQVEALRKGSTLTIDRLWEFVPYNDDPGELISPDFSLVVQAAKAELLAATNASECKDTLAKIVRIYDHEFGDSSEDRNAISLFLYSGPIRSGWTDFSASGNRAGFRRYFHGGGRRCGHLYAGDAYLDTPEKLERLIAFMSQARIERVAVFQVMHHGSEANWHKGVAARIAPDFSVFSSDPHHKKFGHPHAAVVRDFLGYGPTPVDKKRSFVFIGTWK